METFDKTPKNALVVLDEVQALEGWAKLVRQEIERGRRKLIVTGSSAALLSKEIASLLAGRAIPFNVLPLSYRDARAWGLKSVDEYLNVGGYPECVLRPHDAETLHKTYFEVAVLRDVAARQHVRETKPLYDLALILLSEPGKIISSKKTAEKLGISQPTLRSFVQALNDAFLVLSVPPFLRSPRERVVAEARNYAFDTGLQKTVSVSASADHGRRLENLVAIELFRRGYLLSYFKGAAECDFIAQKTGSQTLAVQVYSGDGNLLQREVDGLAEGMKATDAKGLLLSPQPIEAKAPRGAQAKTIEEWLLEKQ